MHTTHTRPRPAARFGAAALAAGLAATAAACGSATVPRASAAGATRSMDVTMTDNAFTPDDLAIRRGETVTLRFTNHGRVAHEAILGDEGTQLRHHDEMSGGHGAMDHSGRGGAAGQRGADTVTVGPGATAELTHTFGETTPMLLGCHQPGHWESGMRANLRIT